MKPCPGTSIMPALRRRRNQVRKAQLDGTPRRFSSSWLVSIPVSARISAVLPWSTSGGPDNDVSVPERSRYAADGGGRRQAAFENRPHVQQAALLTIRLITAPPFSCAGPLRPCRRDYRHGPGGEPLPGTGAASRCCPRHHLGLNAAIRQGGTDVPPFSRVLRTGRRIRSTGSSCWPCRRRCTSSALAQRRRHFIDAKRPVAGAFHERHIRLFPRMMPA